MLVGWASSWATARSCDWPGGLAGGPISLPRRLTIDAAGTRLRQQPFDDARSRARASYHAENGLFRLTITSSAGTVTISKVSKIPTSTLDVDRNTIDPRFQYIRHTHLDFKTEDIWALTLFLDGPLIELFIEPLGVSVTAVLPGSNHNVEFISISCAG